MNTRIMFIEFMLFLIAADVIKSEVLATVFSWMVVVWAIMLAIGLVQKVMKNLLERKIRKHLERQAKGRDKS